MSYTDPKRGIPGIPTGALDAITDQNTQAVLRAIVDGWNVRNGASGNGDSRFVTAKEIGFFSGQVGGLPSGGMQSPAQTGMPITGQQINRIITDLQASVMASQLWQDLGSRVNLININLDGLHTGLTHETSQRVTADEAIITGVDQQITRIDNSVSGLRIEQTTTANSLNALSEQVTTQFASVNGNLSALQVQQTATANNVSAVSSSLTTLQATVENNTAAIASEIQTRVNADGEINAKYTVKIDVNGYVSGFGLISTANNSTPNSEFIVRADRFAIGSPSGPGIAPTAPFIVLTTPDSKGNQPGVYIDSAIIKNAAVGTLTLDGNAVTVPWSYSGGSNAISAGSTHNVVNGGGYGNAIYLDYPTNVLAVCSFLVSKGSTGIASPAMYVTVDGYVSALVYSPSGLDGFSSESGGGQGTLNLSAGWHTIYVWFAEGSSANSYTVNSWSLTLLGCKR